jgi:endoglucanase Acf2
MAQERSRRSHPRRSEVIINLPLNAEPIANLATNTTYIVQLSPGEYDLTLSAWTEGNTDGAVDIKLKPFVNGLQTVAGNALWAHEQGMSTVTTTISVAANNTAAGVIGQYIADSGTGGNVLGSPLQVTVPHGLQLLVDTNTNATTGASLGNLTVELQAGIRT